MKNHFLITLIIAFSLSSCKDDIELSQSPEMNLKDSNKEIQIEDNDWETSPVLECDETLSPIELVGLWEMMNAKIYDKKNICFRGYLFSQEQIDNTVTAYFTFKPFTEQDANIPMVMCEFEERSSEYVKTKNVGDELELKGRLISIKDLDNHNFKMIMCSVF